MANCKYSKDINTLSQLSHGHLPSLNKIADRTSENKMTNISKMKTLLVTGKRLAKRVILLKGSQNFKQRMQKHKKYMG